MNFDNSNNNSINNSNNNSNSIMKSLRYVAVVIILGLVGVGCDQYDYEVDPNKPKLEFTNQPVEEIQEGEDYDVVLEFENAPADSVSLYAFNNTEAWINAELIDDGNSIRITGVAPNIPTDQDELNGDFQVTASHPDKYNDWIRFGVTVVR